MKLEILSYYSTDIDNIWEWEPSSSEEVYFHLEIEIGEHGIKCGHIFHMTIATPEGLRHFSQEFKSEFPDRNLLVFSKYNWAILQDKLENILSKCSRKTWDDSVRCLQRYFLWEYENR